MILKETMPVHRFRCRDNATKDRDLAFRANAIPYPVDSNEILEFQLLENSKLLHVRLQCEALVQHKLERLATSRKTYLCLHRFRGLFVSWLWLSNPAFCENQQRTKCVFSVKTSSLCVSFGGNWLQSFASGLAEPGLSTVKMACAARWSCVAWMTMTSFCCGDAYRIPCGVGDENRL